MNYDCARRGYQITSWPWWIGALDLECFTLRQFIARRNPGLSLQRVEPRIRRKLRRCWRRLQRKHPAKQNEALARLKPL